MSFFKDAPSSLALKSGAIGPEPRAGREHNIQDKFTSPKLVTAFCAHRLGRMSRSRFSVPVLRGRLSFHRIPQQRFHWRIHPRRAPHLAVTEVSISVFLGQFSHAQKQRRDRFLWSGLLSVALTFLLLIAFLFLFKLTAHYSREILILQLAGCCLASLAIRSAIFSGFQMAIAKRKIPGRRMIVFGDEAHCDQYTGRLRILNDNVQIICRNIPDNIRRDSPIATRDGLVSSSSVVCCMATISLSSRETPIRLT